MPNVFVSFVVSDNKPPHNCRVKYSPSASGVVTYGVGLMLSPKKKTKKNSINSLLDAYQNMVNTVTSKYQQYILQTFNPLYMKVRYVSQLKIHVIVLKMLLC